MKTHKPNQLTIVILFLGLLFLITPLMTEKVYAIEFGDGVGSPASGSYATWQIKEGKAPAPFNNWAKTVQATASYRDDAYLRRTLADMGTGSRNPDGSYETLYATCKRSDYIWWYASGNAKDKPIGYWYTQGSGLNYIPPGNWQTMSTSAKMTLAIYKAQSSAWSEGHVVIICSATFVQPVPKDIPITVQAKSGTYTYDGKSKTVSGYTKTAGTLESGHKLSVTSTKSATNVGSYAVPVSAVKVLDSSGKDVSGQYKITTKQGALRINPVATITGDDTRCISPLTASTSSYVHTKTTGSHGYTPDGVDSLNKVETGNWTTAGNYANSNGFPGIGANITAWNTWKKAFEAGSSKTTPTIDLEAAGVTGVLSTHGGVYNVLNTVRKDTYSIETCQPQTREKVTKTKTEYTNVVTENPDGSTKTEKVAHEYKYQEWSAWENDGVRKLTKSSGPTTTYEYSNYQILSVNCNIDGFTKIKDAVGGQVIQIGSGDGSSVLKTPSKSGTTTGELGKTGETRNDKFYTEGTSCKQVFKCIVAPGAGLTNDAKNNKGNTNLFGEVVQGEDLGNPNGNGELVFFRDNEERKVRSDLWYPKATGKTDLISYSGAAPKETFVKLYGKGMSGQADPTPELELTTIAPWDPASGRNNGMDKLDVVENFPGSVNTFNMKSQWASTEGAPYQLGVNWEYKATGKNKVPSKVDGSVIKESKETSHDFDVYCDFRNGNTEYNAKIPDTPYADGLVSPVWSPTNAIRALFSRSASNMD